MCAAAALVGLVAPMEAFATTSEQGRPTATTKEPEIKVAPICPSSFFDGFDEAAKAPLKEARNQGRALLPKLPGRF